MDPNIKNGMFVIRNHHVECVPKKNVTLFEKMSGKTNLFNVIHKLESDIKNNHFQSENEINQLRGRVTQLREMHESNTKNSKFFKLMTKVYHFFGLNFLKNCDTLDNLINKKQTEGFLPPTGAIPHNKLTKVQKHLKNIMTNTNSAQEIDNRMKKFNVHDIQTSNEVIEYLVRNCTKEEAHDLLEYGLYIDCREYTGSGSYFRWAFRTATTQEKNQLKSHIMDLGLKGINDEKLDQAEISSRLRVTFGFLELLSPQYAKEYLLEIFAKGEYEYIRSCCGLPFNLIIQHLVSTDLENLPKEQLQKVFFAALSSRNRHVIDCFTGNVAKKMFEDQTTAAITLNIFKECRRGFIPQTDFHVLILKKAFELGIERDDLSSIMNNLRWGDDPDKYVKKITEFASEKSDTPFLLWSPITFTPTVDESEESYKDLAKHISKLNDGKNAAEVYLDEFTKARLNTSKQKYDAGTLKKSMKNQGYKEDEINSKIQVFEELTKIFEENDLKDVFEHEIFPKVTGRDVSQDVTSLELALGKFFIFHEDLFYELRDPEVINSLLDFLINDNNTPRTFRYFGAKEYNTYRCEIKNDRSAQVFIKEYLERLELPKDAELYAFVLQRLANKYSTQLKKLPYDYDGIESISLNFPEELRIDKTTARSNENEERFSFDVYEKVIDDYKPLYIHLYKPWLEGDFLVHLNKLELNDKTALTYEVISKGLRNHMATQIAEGGDLFKNTHNWRPEMLLLFFSVSQDSSYSKNEEENRLAAITEIKKRFSELNIEKFVGKLLDNIETKDSKSQTVAQELLSNLLKLDSNITERLPKELKDRLEKHR